jgi:SpoVK/Ycf46/Vps4 family AAA+-type ATPase
MSGAELSALISSAAMNAIRSVITNIEVDQPQPEKVRIEKEHIEQALIGIVKSQ